MTPPEISVLLPTNVLNSWVDAAVTSLLTQTGVTFEVIVIHDGIRPDKTRPWTNDPRVRCIETPVSLGLASALNVGAAASLGSYLARLDGDDISLPGRLVAQHKILEEATDVVLVGTRAEIIDEEDRPQWEFGEHTAGDVRRTLLRRNAVIHPSVMLRRSVFELVGGYNSRLRTMEDYDLWLRMATQGEVRVLQSTFVQYRVHSNQMSRGAAATGAHITAILHSRRKLAAALGSPLVYQMGYDALWWAAQVGRHRGWRRPGYLK